MLALFGLTAVAEAKVIYVAKTGSDANDGLSWATAKTTVPAGFSIAKAGDEVWVAAGTYASRVTVRSGVALYGGFAGGEAQLTDRDWTANVTIQTLPLSVALGAVPGTRIDGFTIRCAPGTIVVAKGGGINCSSTTTPSAITIANNTIIGNTATYGGGIYCSNTVAVISNNTIVGNSATSGGGIYCDANSSATIVGNTIVANAANAGGGIYCNSVSATPSIVNNVVAFNSSGIHNADGAPSLRTNCIYNPDGPNYSGLIRDTSDIVADPSLTDARGGDVHLKAGSPCIDAGDDLAPPAGVVDVDGEPRVQGAHIDIGADEFNGTTPSHMRTIIRVASSGNDANDGSSWAMAKRTIQSGIDAASSLRGEVWVAAGMYNERIALKPMAYAYGGFAGTEQGRDDRDWTRNVTILDGGSAGSVVTAQTIPGYGVSGIDGFTIRNGSAVSSGAAYNGGGIFCYNSSPIISNNTITGNTAGNGGGISCSNARPTILNNTIAGNTAIDKNAGGGGIHCSNSWLILSDTLVSGNSAKYGYGGAIYFDSASPQVTIVRNAIKGNTAARGGGGIYGVNPLSAGILNNTITENVGGGVYCGGTVTVFNNAIMGNVANTAGGGVFCSEGSPCLLNNTILHNVAKEGGGIYCGQPASPMVSNNIVAFNTSGMYNAGGSPVLRHNCIYHPDRLNYSGVQPGVGDISADPQILSVDYEEIHLGPESPCINAGLDDPVQTGWTDMDGEPRIHGEHVDIGADEFNGTAPAYTPMVVRVNPEGNDANDGSSWPLAKRTIQAAIDAAANHRGEVWVAAGNYLERITLRPLVGLYGGFSGIETERQQRDWQRYASILDGQAGGSVVTTPLSDRMSGTIDGFTIRNGKAAGGGGIRCYTSISIVNNLITGNEALNTGGAIECERASPTITNNMISGNRAPSFGELGGGGICCVYNLASPVITNNTITSNTGGGIRCDGSSPLISGNRIADNTGTYGAGISCVSSSPTITNNLLTGNVTSVYAGAIYCTWSSPVISGNRIIGNSASPAGGIYCDTSSSPAIANNTIAGNAGGGIYCNTSSPMILNNTIVSNANGVSCASASPTIVNTIIAFNGTGVFNSDGTPSLRSNCVFANTDFNFSGLIDPTNRDGNISSDPRLTSRSYGNEHLQPDSPCVNAGDDGAVSTDWKDIDGQSRILGTHVDIGADESDGTLGAQGPYVIVRVSPQGNDINDGSSWSSPKRTVQAAINTASVQGGEVWVQAGTYFEQIAMRPYVYLYGGFGGTETTCQERDFRTFASILDGQAGGSVATIRLGGHLTGTIDGFTIRNGKASVGGGIYCVSSALIIANNTIAENVAANYGGGIMCSGSYGMVISRNTITGNRLEGSGSPLGAGIYCNGSSATITDNTIENNPGGGIFCYRSSSTITGNMIRGNTAGSGIVCSQSPSSIVNNLITGNTGTTGAGLCISDSNSSAIANNTIAENDASEGGGIYCLKSNPTISDNVITGNTARVGGGVYCYYISSPTITNNTLTGNNATEGGAIGCDNDSCPTITNTIVAFNSSGIYRNYGTQALRFNCVYGNVAYNYAGLADPTGTDGNVSVDPRLESSPYGRVHLQPDSPCIDAGDDGAVGSGWTDIDAQVRIAGSHVDIGADESYGTVWPKGPYVIVRVSPEGNDANDGSSWPSAKRSVQAAIGAAAASRGDVWVKAGTYPERIELQRYVHVYGGFRGTESQRQERDWHTNVSILDGQLQGSTVTAKQVGCELSSIDGFTIRNGKAPSGGAICCSYSSPTISNNRITGNTAVGGTTFSGGGGIYCYSSSPTITNNMIIGNNALGTTEGDGGGGVYPFCASPVITHNTITGNTSANNGGGISCASSSCVIKNNTITGNNSAGSESYDGGGGICCRGSSPTITNNVITGNSAESSGGGICASFSLLTVTNTTVTGNTASLGGGIYSSAYSCTMINTIVAFNSSGVYVDDRESLWFNCVFSNTGFNYAGMMIAPTTINGNISVDPGFVRTPSPGADGAWGTSDDDYGDLHLKAGSPCIDAGDNSAAPAGILTDLDGLPRFFNDPATPDTGVGTAPIVDIGAYEYIPGDFDRDGDIDADDMKTFAACASGPAIPYAGDCGKADFDKDGDVDQSDFGVLQRCFSGTNGRVQADCVQ